MFALEVEYLLGRALATARTDRTCAEWPPHPARLFSALVATLHEADLSEAERTAAHAALAWLEQLPPPALYADPPLAEGYGRAVLNAWMPVNPTRGEVNDRSDLPRALLSEGLRVPRKRAERTFPAFAPHDPRVVFIWGAADEAAVIEHRPALARLADELGYLGHSMSPVRARWLDDAPAPTLLPAEQGELTLRVPGPGRLARLEQCFAQSQDVQRRIEPPLGRYQAYTLARTAANQAPARGLFRIGAVFRRAGGPRLPLEAGIALADAVRANLLRVTAPPVPAVISGHTPDGGVSSEPHLAVAPLPWVGDPRFPGDADPLDPATLREPLAWTAPYADGGLKGVAVLAPARLAPAERDAVELALYRLADEPLLLGRYGEWRIARLSVHERGQALQTLNADHWTRPARLWASVTPVVFGHHPRAGNPRRDGLAVLSRACQDIGLPAPEAVSFGGISAFRGALPARRYRDIQGERAVRLLDHRFIAHVRLRFAEPVAGPLVLGAGRFYGLGLCRPLYGEEDTQ